MKPKAIKAVSSAVVMGVLLLLFQNMALVDRIEIGLDGLNPFISRANDELAKVDAKIYDELMKQRANIGRIISQLSQVEKVLKQAPIVAEKLKIKISPRTLNEIQNVRNDLLKYRADLEYWKSQADGYINDPEHVQNIVNQIERLKNEYDKLQVKIEDIEARYKASVRYISAIVSNLDKSVFTDVFDMVNCDKSGNLGDERSSSKQYFCDEIPYGETVRGISYAMYILDPIRFNSELNILEDRVQTEMRMVGKRWQQIEVRAQSVVQKTLSFIEFQQRMANQWVTWNRDKVMLRFPFQYKDAKGIRSYPIEIAMSRKFNSGFHTYNGQIIASARTAYMGTCVNVPGVSIYQSSERMEYAVLKYPWPVNGYLTERMQVTFPGISFTGLQFCGVFKIDLEDIKRPKISIVYASLPTPVDLKFQPLKIDIKSNYFTSILGTLDLGLRIISLGSLNLDKIANNLLTNMQNKEVEKFKNGEVFLMLMQGAFLDSVKSKITQDPMGQFSQLKSNLPQNQAFFQGNDVGAYLKWVLQTNSISMVEEF